MKTFNPDRRKFLKLGAAVAGSSLVLGISWSCSPDDGGDSDAPAQQFSPNAWLKIDDDGKTTVIVAESEMGQGPYTLMPMILAEELDVEWKSIVVEHASLDPVYGYQSTGGSTSIRKGWTTLREAGAIAREILRRSGAIALDAPLDECTAKNGMVLHQQSGRQIPYHKLIPIAVEQPLPETARLKELDEFTLIGQPLPRTDLAEKINGQARFGIDIRLPDMLYATITHCPVFGGTAKQVDASEAMKIPGVKDVFTIDEGVVVVATNTWTAFTAKDTLKIGWDYGSKASLSSDQIATQLRDLPRDKGEVAWDEGDSSTVLASADRQIEADYLQPLQAHVPLEPMNCTAHFRPDGKLEIWAPTQSPSTAYGNARRIAQSGFERGLKKLQKTLFGGWDQSVEVHTTLLGGGFGRRLEQDFVDKAVKVAQRYQQPVQLVWTREEDVQHDFYHPLTLHRMRGALDDEGMPIAWEHQICGTKISAGAAAPPPYSIPNIRVVTSDIGAVIPRGPWRSVFAHYNAFAVEHFFDELAHAGKQDPLELRLKLLSEHPRLRGVLELAAEKAGWSSGVDGSRFLGAAVLSSFGSHVAETVELRPAGESGLRVHKVICAIDCGVVINPDIVKQQMEGSIIFALTAALKSRITVKNGRVQQSNFHNYPILRFDETPEIEVYMMRNEEEPGGIGEPGVPPLAPALANAVLAATGQAVRELPIDLSSLNPL